MIWQQFSAILWLRWRIMANQWRRAGAFNAWVMGIVAVLAVGTAIPLFFGSIALGIYVIPQAQPMHLMFAWDCLVVAFLFFWMIGLITDLQRSEPLSLSKFMHLPVSPNGAFLINYFSSFLRLSLIVFGPIMLGFALALLFAKGVSQLLTLPLLAAFLLMTTALTYQFQGWLAALMSNPRRRRTVIMIVTFAFILITQLPNLLNFVGLNRQLNRGRAARQKDLEAVEKFNEHPELLEQVQVAKRQADRESLQWWEQRVRIANMVLPIGWLPNGVVSAAEGDFLQPLLGLAGMMLIGSASLAMAYRTTVGQYQKQASGRRVRSAHPVGSTAATPTPATARRGGLLLEARVFQFSEPVSAIALAGLRSLLRAPEAKMMLLTPLFTGVIFGSMLWRNRDTMPETMRPLVAIGGVVCVLFALMQIMGNQFGFDRDGFRVYVLCAASRRDILLGKNLSFAPIALGLGLMYLLALQVICPLRPDHFLATLPQSVSMFLMFCLYTNLLSIYTPVHMAEGTLKPSNMTLTLGLLQFLMFLVIFPLTQIPTLLPLGIEAGLHLLGHGVGIPIYLLLSLLECAIVVFVYRLLLRWEGDLFQGREQKILECVTNRAS